MSLLSLIAYIMATYTSGVLLESCAIDSGVEVFFVCCFSLDFVYAAPSLHTALAACHA